MESRDQALIGRYLAHEASADEIREVEERRENDKAFRHMLIDSEMALEALRLHQREELRNRFKKRDEILDLKAGKDSGQRGRWYSLFALLFIGLGIYIWQLIPSSSRTVFPAPVHLQDSLPASEQQRNTIDTTAHQESQQSPPIRDKVQDRKESQHMAESDEQGDKLFAAYFSPHVDEMMDPAVRGDGELTPLEKFQLAYWEKRYSDALKEFPSISATMKQNDNVRFMQANALMATGGIQDAQTILGSILANQKSRYLTEVAWYLALCEIKMSRNTDGYEHLRKYIENPNALHAEEAKKLLQAIKN